MLLTKSNPHKRRLVLIMIGDSLGSEFACRCVCVCEWVVGG